MVDSTDPELLIEAIQAHPCLWDMFSPDYNDRLNTRQAWNEVTKTLFPDIDSFSEQEKNSIVLGLQRKWRNLRDSYVKDLRVWTGKSPSGVRAAKRRKYIFFDKLSFLKPSVESKMSRLHFPQLNRRANDSDENSLSDDEGTTVPGDYSIDSKMLIAMVEATPCIWDPTHPDYRDRNKTKQSWLNLCRVFYPQYDDLQEADRINILGTLQKMWRNFRDCFVKDWRASQTPSLRPLRRKKYIFYDKLQFLLKSVEWKSKNNSKFTPKEENSDELKYSEYDGWFDDGGPIFEDDEPVELEKKYNPQEHAARGESVQIFPICAINNCPQEGEGRQLNHVEENSTGPSVVIGEIKSVEQKPAAHRPQSPHHAPAARPMTPGNPAAQTPTLEVFPVVQSRNPQVPAPQSNIPHTPAVQPATHPAVQTPTPPLPAAQPQAPHLLAAQPSTPQLPAAESPAPQHFPSIQSPANSFQQDVFTRFLEDDDLAFFFSLLPSVRRLGEEEKLDFRVEVMQLLRKSRRSKDGDTIS